MGEVNSGHEIFDFTLIYPIFDVESIGDGPRVPRAHLRVVFATTQRTYLPTLVCVLDSTRKTEHGPYERDAHP